ncbi:hypothetical protein [Deinococcus radiophilus]|nr:hypothetical protein [Deinococcus radiophilus]UFA50369.1 hypothetical protein LMT64_00125 [Deinococcus radiophilus]
MQHLNCNTAPTCGGTTAPGSCWTRLPAFEAPSPGITWRTPPQNFNFYLLEEGHEHPYPD